MCLCWPLPLIERNGGTLGNESQRWKRLGPNSSEPNRTNPIQSNPIQSERVVTCNKAELRCRRILVFYNKQLPLINKNESIIKLSTYFSLVAGARFGLLQCLSIRNLPPAFAASCFSMPNPLYAPQCHAFIPKGVRRKVSKMACSTTECPRLNIMLNRDTWLSAN